MIIRPFRPKKPLSRRTLFAESESFAPLVAGIILQSESCDLWSAPARVRVDIVSLLAPRDFHPRLPNLLQASFSAARSVC